MTVENFILSKHVPGTELYWISMTGPEIEALIKEYINQHIECEHPYHSVVGGEMKPAKCLKCGKYL